MPSPLFCLENEATSVPLAISLRRSSLASMRPIFIVPGLRYILCLVSRRLFVCLSVCFRIDDDDDDVACDRLRRRGFHRRGIRDWRICVGGFGIWLVRKSRFFFIYLYV